MTMPRLQILVLVFCLGAANAFGQSTPTDVYLKALEIAAEVDLIRLEMGITEVATGDIGVSGAQPREVYFQALTLHKKANRLLFEQLREREDSPSRMPAEVGSETVFALVNRTLGLVLRVKQALGVTETAVVEPPSEARSPTDVYKLIVRVNRTLNSLLQQRFAPAEVYQQLTYGIGLSSNILATVASSERLGTEAPLARRKTPVDVYRQLIEIYQIVHETMKLSGEECLVIEPAESERNDVSPSDVYDLASLLVSELSHLHSIAPGVIAPKESYYPGDKLPSHVFQRSTRLESQMITLRNYVSQHPAWLKPQ